MQRPHTMPLNQNSSARPASMGFLPPTWPDLFPFLVFSAFIWLSLLAIAAVRYLIYRFFRSSTFRKIVKSAKQGNSKHSLLLTAARMYHNATFLLQRARPPESLVARYFGLPRAIVGCIICFLYMVDTYTQGIPPWCYVVQCIYGFAVSANLVFQFVYAERPVRFSFNVTTVVDCLSIPSLLLSSNGRWLNFNFLQAYCVLVEWNVLERHDIVLQNTAAVWRLSLNLFLQLATFLYVTSCGVQFFELLGELPFKSLKSETFQITWANAVYFAVVTLMTVGYGDFAPYTFLGRMWVVFHIILAAYLVSRGISLLIEALQSMRRGDGSYVNSPGTDHVVITGHVKWEFLRQFVSEFLGDVSNIGTKVIVLTSNPNWNEGDWNRFIDIKPLFDHHLMYLDGSALKPDDLHRAHVDAARAVFVLADPRGDPYKEDSDILKAVLTIRNYSSIVPIYTLNMLHESSFQFGIALERSEPTETDVQMRYHTTAGYAVSSTLFGHSFMPGISAPILHVPETHPDTQRNAFLGDIGSNGDLANLSQFGFDLQSGDLPEIDGMTSKQGKKKREISRNRKSSSLCMRELETVFLAENVFCNGLSTLIANATLRAGSPSRDDDPPWLAEYKLGTECSLQSFEIIDEMDGREFSRTAMTFQDYGIILIAVRESFEVDWTIMTTDLILRKGMIAMGFTYYESAQVEIVVADVGKKLVAEDATSTDPEMTAQPPGMNDFSDDISPQDEFAPFHEGEMLAGSDDRYVDRNVELNLGDGPADPITSSNNEEDDVDDAGNGARFQNDSTRTDAVSFERRSVTAGAANVAGSVSTRLQPELDPNVLPEDVDLRSRLRIRENTIQNRTRDQSRRQQQRRQLVVHFSIHQLPAALRGHVIICVEGNNSLTNLDFLLKRIWLKREGQKRRAPIVVIHPRFPKNFAKRLGINQDGLFLLQGNSLAIETLKQAQYQNAKAFLILASDKHEFTARGSTDSKAIFTVMALDSLLARKNVFVCCVLDAEGSLELLRAPKQERRVGGLQKEQKDPELFSYERSPMLGLPTRTASSFSMLRNYPSSVQLSGLHHGTFMQHNLSSGTLRRRRSRAEGLRSANESTMSIGAKSESTDGEASEFFSEHKQFGEREASEKRSRDELFERQRYASGEMMISSLFTALLAREFTDPGYIRLVRQVIGASSVSKSRSWIRQIAIPDSWTRVDQASIDAIAGRTYRELSMKLLGMGCIALGLYRSGDAPVRMTKQVSEHQPRGASETSDEMDYWYGSYRGDSFSSGMMHGGGGSILRTLDNQSFDAVMTGGDIGNFDEGPDEFDQRVYICPTTKNRIHYEEMNNGENALPYVYCFPEPYTCVVSSDMVFVLCNPEVKIPSAWEE